MQRVAIARALVNDPDIILADEPTGALDTETSVQIMEILKEISKEKLIIMVTHNPELAETYSNRIIKLVDGQIIGDTNPYIDDGKEEYRKYNLDKKTSMSFKTALSLSLKNLFTKKARTILTSFAGSIGIIGIATILSMSSGFENYISKVEEDTLSTYPISIYTQNTDYTSTMEALMNSKPVENPKEETIYVNNVMTEVMKAMSEGIKNNDLKAFKSHIEENKDIWEQYAYIQYNYGVSINVYKGDYSSGLEKIVPFSVDAQTAAILEAGGMGTSQIEEMMNQMPSWTEMIDNQELLESQYDIYGKWPSNANEVVIVVDENNTINDFTLCNLGLANFGDMLLDAIQGKEKQYSYSYDEILSKTYHIIPSSAYFTDSNNDGIYSASKSNDLINEIENNRTVEVKITGIVKQKTNASAASINGVIGFTHDLVERLVELSNTSPVIAAQKATPEINVLTGEKFDGTDSTYEKNLVKFGQKDLETPSIINIYPKSFEDKEAIESLIDSYNDGKEKDDTITYTDYIGLMMSSISTIINAISYVLIGFVSISLVVSSIMIGIITYISVLERTKEIGVLRAIGASKKDVSRVFNAETLLIGLVSGTLGIVVTLGIDLIINIILESLVGIAGIAQLPFLGAIILILISVALTMIAGLIPSKLAAKKDPVIALRTE